MLRRTLVLLAALAALTLTAGPAQAATTLWVSPLGDYVSPNIANITGKATCDGGTGTVTFTTLVGSGYTVAGQVAVVCDGLSHDWAATITGGTWFQGGAIFFRATLVAPSGTVPYVAKVVLR